jgi:hypothetical protein
MIAVVVTPRSKVADSLVSQLLPSAMVIVGANRRYAVFEARDSKLDDFSFTDPIDGALLTECHTFQSLSAAKAWIAEDVRGDHA